MTNKRTNKQKDRRTNWQKKDLETEILKDKLGDRKTKSRKTEGQTDRQKDLETEKQDILRDRKT